MSGGGAHGPGQRGRLQLRRIEPFPVQEHGGRAVDAVPAGPVGGRAGPVLVDQVADAAFDVRAGGACLTGEFDQLAVG
jgi:hypothetical protein